MKQKLLAAGLFIAAGNCFAASGIYDSFLFTTTNGGGLTFYDIGAVTPNTDFDSANLGTFSLTDTYQLGGQQKSFKNNFSDVLSHGVFWRVWLTSGGATGSFTGVNMPFQWNQTDGGHPANLNSAGDQQWGGDVQGANSSLTLSSNILSGLAPGNYTLEAYSQITTNSVDAAPVIGNVNGGLNYKATFTLVPEPSAAALGLLGAAMLVRRRRI